jgi:hypothetical protein
MRYQAVVVMPEDRFQNYLAEMAPEENGTLPLFPVQPSLPQPIVIKRVSDYRGVVSVHVAIDTARDYMGAIVLLVNYRGQFRDKQSRTYARDTQPDLPFVWNAARPEVGQHTFADIQPIKAIAFGDLVVTVDASTGKPEIEADDEAEADPALVDAVADARAEADDLLSDWETEADDPEGDEDAADDGEDDGDWDRLDDQPAHRTPVKSAKSASVRNASAKRTRQTKRETIHA